MNVTGTPSIFSLSRGAEAKEKIKKLMESSVPEPSSISSVEEKNPLPTEGSSVSPPSRVINSGEASSRGILPDVPPHVPPHVRQDGRQEIREDVGADGSPSSPYRLPLRTRPGKASPTTSGGGDHPSEFPQPPPKVRLEAMRPDLNPGSNFCWILILTLPQISSPDLSRKEPIDVITDYLRELGSEITPPVSAKRKILDRGYTNNNLPIPATWTVRNGEMMRDAAYAAGLVAPEGSQEYAGGRDRLHIISEPEAGPCTVSFGKIWAETEPVVHGVRRWGGTIDTRAGYGDLPNFRNVTQIAERCASSVASNSKHSAELRESSALYACFHVYTKLGFDGKQHRRHLYFECFDVSDYYNTDLSDDEFFNGQLVVPVSDLQERVFEPIVNKVLGVLEAQLKRVGSVNALLLVGGFSASHIFLIAYGYVYAAFRFPSYLCDVTMDAGDIPRTLAWKDSESMDPDIATSLGTAQSGLAESLIQRQSELRPSSLPELYHRDWSQYSDRRRGNWS
ncbi:hypothetical protein BS47DRAFT_1403145 [Hydnum rufescens UP504]|uniref:Uncharacterized protein n=1 Tax=Hydnum rufescens UP504 TaxID=1448309 RepID=A0A9P6DDZ8_9AGAM|nr:hypothetical protein BS47DRAFT_1403145 [Hydnum rufescens UP504]